MMSDKLCTNSFDWDTHVIKDPLMGFAMQLHLNQKQERQLNRYNSRELKVKSFPTAISLPFINKRNGNWIVQIKWNGQNKIFKTSAFLIAKQFESVYMPFIQEATNRRYLCFNDYDPVNFMNESLQSVKQIPRNSYLRWNNEFGKCIAKISNHKNLYQWNLDGINMYKIQLVNINESISNRAII
eukprot:225409_1